MENRNSIKLILKSKEFIMPPDFCTCLNSNLSVLTNLETKKEYEVKSEVSTEIFQTFINCMINRIFPDINDDNISEYELLSKEFNYMEEYINLYKLKFHNEHNFDPPKLHELNRVQLGSTITSIINNNSFLIYSTVNGSIGYLISVKSQSVFQNLSIMQNRMRNEYIRHIGICSGKYNSLCSTIGIVDYNFIQSYLNIEKNTDLIQFYDVTSLTCLLQYINL